MTAGWTVLLALFLVFGDVMAVSRSDIVLSSTRIAQGDSASIVIRTGGEKKPRVLWMGRPVDLVFDGENRAWYGFFGVDLGAEPGPATLVVEPGPAEKKQRFKMTVVKKDRGVRVLTLPPEMVELDAETLERVKRESGVMKEVLGAPPGEPRWRASFTKPLEGEVAGVFGTRSIINGEPRSPHSGVDLRAAAGTPVKSIQNGTVALIADHFFSGKSVVVDHGGAIQSMYFHLEKTLVKEGEEVKRGEVIGLVGATGRATGPHLHFGMRVNGARVDPLQFVTLSEQTERP
jgi:murein DD-endopeptidase MepM/ murein hydrolase activator NlpD